MTGLELKERRLEEGLKSVPSLVVAYSGGVDSAYLAYAAHRVLGKRMLAVTALSASYSARDRREAQACVERFNFPHEFVETGELENPAYRAPLEATARSLADYAGAGAEFVLLGSVASAKYVDVLGAIFGSRLVFPSDFVGRGDMSRGGLLLRAAEAGQELRYEPVQGAVRHGPRPARLEPLHRNWKLEVIK